MNFFQHQERARSRTLLLVFYLSVAVLLIIGAVDLTVTAFLTNYGYQRSPNTPPQQLHSVISLIVLAVVLFGTIQGWLRLRGGGRKIAERIGARPVSRSTPDPNEKRLLNVVDEMAIAAGMIVPPVYVFEGSEINAFAAGTEPNNAVIAVSRGVLANLTRDELQSVIAHEFSHIFNGDMRISLRLLGILNGILMIAIIGRILMRTRGRKNPLPLLGLALFLIGYLGVFMSRLIKSAVSRQRELLADASAVQFTRNPQGLLGALVKIQRGSSYVPHQNAEELSHFFFAQGFRSFLDSWFATHPPLNERMHAIDPSFQPERYIAAQVAKQPTAAPAPAPKPVAPLKPLPVMPSVAAMATAAVATPTARDVETAASFLAGLPPALSKTLSSSNEAAWVVYALLLSDNAALRQRQVSAFHAADPRAAAASESLKRDIDSSQAKRRLPYVELAIPALKQLPAGEHPRILERARMLIRFDNRITPFEFAVEIILANALGNDERVATAAPGEMADMICLLSYLAYAGAPGNETRANAAFQKGFTELQIPAPKVILPWQDCGSDAARDALRRLTKAPIKSKATYVAALAACVIADGAVNPDEWELLRALCQCLGCPMPMLPNDFVH